MPASFLPTKNNVPPARLLGGGIILLCLLTLGAANWTALQQTYWWYPETDAYQIWVLGMWMLVLFSHLRWEKGGQAQRVLIGLLWLVMVAILLSGIWALMCRIHEHLLCGDLLQNYLEGARRLERGSRVYDVAGLKQSVNASPLAISLYYPLRHLGNRDAIIGALGLNLVMLSLFVVGACLLVRRIKGQLTLPDALFPLVSAVTFYTFQRSWRLGKLDTILLALLTLGLALSPRGDRKGLLSAPLFALATGLKLIPGMAAGPMLVARARAISEKTGGTGRPRRTIMRWVGLFVLAFTLVVGLAVAQMGLQNTSDFVVNVPNISQGSSSGNNFSLIARVATFNDRELRKSHSTLPPAYARAGTALTLVTLIFLLFFTWRHYRADYTLLCSVWLAAVPFTSPVCWDVYLLWCSFLPWLVVWIHFMDRSRPELTGKDRSSRLLFGLVLLGSYLLAGTAGNTTITDIKTSMRFGSGLPAWVDEFPLVGHALLVGALLLVTVRDHGRRAAALAKSEP